MSNEHGYRGVDLDGSLAAYGEWKGSDVIGEPIPKMVERVKRWLAAGEEVRIVTARVGPGIPPDERDKAWAAIKLWCLQHLGQELPVQSYKCYQMRELWDDRAIQLVPNSGERADGKPD
jgi:hypothetical protein